MATEAERLRLLITGSRNWADANRIRRELAARYRDGLVLVSGGCPRGADAIGEQIWRQLGGSVERHPADWQRHGRAAGYIRNAEMVRLVNEPATAPTGIAATVNAGSPSAAPAIEHSAATAGLTMLPDARLTIAVTRRVTSPISTGCQYCMANAACLFQARAVGRVTNWVTIVSFVHRLPRTPMDRLGRPAHR